MHSLMKFSPCVTVRSCSVVLHHSALNPVHLFVRRIVPSLPQLSSFQIPILEVVDLGALNACEGGSFMTDTASEPSLRPQMKAAVIDTTLPYKNVQAAVRMFGEKGDQAKTIKPHDKHGPIEMDMHELKEELVRVRAQVVDEQTQRASALSELNSLKMALESNQVYGNGSPSCKDGQLVRENTAKQHHAIILAELEGVKTQRNRLEQELSVALQEKEHAQRQAEEATLMAEVNAKRAEDLSKEIVGTKESLLLVKMACVETNKEREFLWAARKAQTSGHPHTPSPGSPTKLNNKLEHKLNTGKADFTKDDFRLIRQSLVSAREALTNIDRLKAGCGSPVTDATIALELEAVKSEVCKALESDAILESTLKEVQDKLNEAKQELDATRVELVEMRSREASANVEMVKLKLELEKVQSELKAAASCNEAFVGFSQRLQRESTQDREVVLATCKANDAAKAELHALLKEEVEAVRQNTPKISQDLCVHGKSDRLETVYEDQNMVLSQYEGFNASPDLHESTARALSSEMSVSFKEELKKKKFSLLSLTKLLSKSKRRAQKGMSLTLEDA